MTQHPPPEFIPAKPRRMLIHALEWLNRLVILRWLEITVEMPAEDLERLKAIPPGTGVLLASNHPTFADPSIIFEVTRRWGRMCNYIAAREIFNKFGGWMGSVIRRAGAFSVFRGGANQMAALFVQRTLQAAHFPIVVFPEGHTFYLNDVLLPLKPGVAAWAVDTVAAGNAPPVVIVPIIIKYHFEADIREPLDRAVSQMEGIVLKSMPEVPPGEYWDRLYLRLHRIANAILSRQERRHHYHPPRGGADLDERVQGLCAHILNDLERRYIGEAREGDFFDRARHLMALLKDDDNPQHHTDALDARFAWALSTFHAGYLQPDSSPERFAETVMKLQREITHRVPLTFRAPKTAHVRVGEPIEVARFVTPACRDDEHARREVTHEVLGVLTERMRGLLDGFSGNVRTPSGVN